VGVQAEWKILIRRVDIVGETMTVQFPLGPGGPPVGGAPPTDIGPGGELWGHHECWVYVFIGLYPFCTYRGEGTH
jgi:hypothetical protein